MKFIFLVSFSLYSLALSLFSLFIVVVREAKEGQVGTMSRAKSQSVSCSVLPQNVSRPGITVNQVRLLDELLFELRVLHS